MHTEHVHRIQSRYPVSHDDAPSAAEPRNHTKLLFVERAVAACSRKSPTRKRGSRKNYKVVDHNTPG